jgi:hypothetical protein
MKTQDTRFQNPAEKKPIDVMQDFVLIFSNKGWLNQTLRIKRGDRRYRLFCNERQFFVYRINDHCGGSHGFPGWPVCIVTDEKIIDDSEMCGFASTEPSPHDWLRCIADDDFEFI